MTKIPQNKILLSSVLSRFIAYVSIDNFYSSLDTFEKELIADYATGDKTKKSYVNDGINDLYNTFKEDLYNDADEMVDIEFDIIKKAYNWE